MNQGRLAELYDETVALCRARLLEACESSLVYNTMLHELIDRYQPSTRHATVAHQINADGYVVNDLIQRALSQPRQATPQPIRAALVNCAAAFAKLRAVIIDEVGNDPTTMPAGVLTDTPWSLLARQVR